MAVFGLTGSPSSGKTTVLKLLESKGAIVFDIDEKVHQYYRDKTSKVYKKIASKFPESVIDGDISRRKIAKEVFFDEKRLKELERIVHPVVLDDLSNWVATAKTRQGIYVAEVPLLFEKKLKNWFDKTILVKTKREILIKRLIKKYNISQSNARKRLSLYLPVREKIKRSDFVINNSENLKMLKKEVELLWRRVNQK